MGSIIMHLCISEKIRQKYNFSDNFLIGSVLPDIYKKVSMPREESHYLEYVKYKDQTLALPNIDEYMKLNISKNHDEITLGYLSHLIEDRIWFKDFIARYIKFIGQNKSGEDLFRYQKENFEIIHEDHDMKNELYQDYSYLNKIALSIVPVNIDNIRKKCNSFFNNDIKYLEVINKDISVIAPTIGRKNYFISEEDLKEYFDFSYKKLDIILPKFISL